MFSSPSLKVLHLGRRGLGAATVAMLAVVLMLPGISGALTSGEEHSDDSYTLGEIAEQIGAEGLRESGITGEGVTVAVIDTGVADVPGLDAPGKVIHGPDLSFESGVPELYNRDSFGHGTAMASIIAGDDGTEDGFTGIAPGARILSMKVADNTGSVDVTQVIAAIDFVVETRDETDVRVLNLAYRTDGGSDRRTDPLVAAVERAWEAGIVVVVSAGNDGGSTLGNPALSPQVIAVAAGEENEREPASFSNTGELRAPDLTAPGSRVLALAAPGSRLAEEHPGAVIDGRFLRGSGTSQAAAVVSGAAALLIEADPSLTPDQIKAQLILGVDEHGEKSRAAMRSKKLDELDAADRLEWSQEWSGTQLGDLDFEDDMGAGYLNVGRSAGIDAQGFFQSHATSDGSGPLDDARGSVIALTPEGIAITGEVDFTGGSWSGATWSGATWSGGSWSGATWSGASWSGATWTGGSWSGASWSGASWSGASWSGATWSGGSWSGASWSGASWSGASWSGATWSGISWG